MPNSATPCRMCGGTCLDPKDPNRSCGQCKGAGVMRVGDPMNRAGPGVERLARHAQAHTPVPAKGKGAAYMIVWDKVRGREARLLIKGVQDAYPRTTRRQRRRYEVLVLKAMRLGLLVPAVPEGKEKLTDPATVP